MPTHKAHLLLTLATMFWGMQPMFVKWLMHSMTPVTLTLLRYLCISAVMFVMLLWHKDERPISRRNWLLIVLMGLSGIAVNNIVQFGGLKLSTVTNSTLIAAASPTVTATLALLFLKERLIPLQWAGIVISFLGALFLLVKGRLDVLLSLSFNLGDICFVISQTSWSVYSLLSVPVLREVSAIRAVAWSGLIGAGFTALWGAIMGELMLPPLTPEVLGAFAYVTFGGGVCAMLCWNLGVRAVGASEASIFLNVQLVMGLFCGVAFLDEPFQIQQGCGSLAILCGVFLLTNSHKIQVWRDTRPSKRSLLQLVRHPLHHLRHRR